jgi:hypothetical protein
MPQCQNPYIPAGNPDVPAPCRKCWACKVNLKRLWTHRLILESEAHEKMSFITLTYDEKHWPKDGSLSIPVMQGYHKRLRTGLSRGLYSYTGEPTYRHYTVGEYGDDTWRPHYHIALFGACCDLDGGCTLYKRKKVREFYEKYPLADHVPREIYWDKICPTCKNVEKAWGNGFVDVEPFNAKTAAYICGYVTKKMTKDDDERLRRDNNIYLHPEFFTQSRNIGWPGFKLVLDEMVKSPYFDRFLTPYGDVPYSLRHEGKSYPIGRHLREKARKYLKMEEAYDHETGEIKFVSKEAQKIAQKAEMQEMRKDEKYSEDAQVSLKIFMREKNTQHNKNLEKRYNIFKKERKL